MCAGTLKVLRYPLLETSVASLKANLLTQFLQQQQKIIHQNMITRLSPAQLCKSVSVMKSQAIRAFCWKKNTSKINISPYSICQLN